MEGEGEVEEEKDMIGIKRFREKNGGLRIGKVAGRNWNNGGLIERENLRERGGIMRSQFVPCLCLPCHVIKASINRGMEWIQDSSGRNEICSLFFSSIL